MKIRALIIDDEKQSVQLIKERTEWKKLKIDEVYEAYSADEARKVMEEHGIQLVLCDIEMPGENGLEFIQWLREESDLNGKNMECIILTCYPEYSYMRKALQLGCSDYLIKPIEKKELEKVVEKAVSAIMSMSLPENPEFYEENDENIVEMKIIPYIHDHYTEMITVSEIADYAALNPQYMMRLFKKERGESILEYVTSLRLELSKELLRKTDLTNEQIADRVGYATSNYFIKLFKKVYRMTPREYRKQKK